MTHIVDGKPLFVTSNENPDLDGFACSYGYAEWLKKQKIDCITVLCGEYQVEVEFLVTRYGISGVARVDDLIINDNPIVIVDASDLRGLSKKIPPDNIIEVIDHRKYYRKEDFPRARFQIELVGAAATLIAEKFIESEIAISLESARLLYYAIASNTINLKANVTTERDLKAFAWLGKRIQYDPFIISEMFEYKTKNIKITKESFLGNYSAFFEVLDKNIGIIQLEITEARQFFLANKIECTQILQGIKQEFKLDFVFMTAIDLVEGNNYFFTPYKQSKRLLESSLETKFEGSVAYREGILMRKEIVPIMTEAVKHTSQ